MQHRLSQVQTDKTAADDYLIIDSVSHICTIKLLVFKTLWNVLKMPVFKLLFQLTVQKPKDSLFTIINDKDEQQNF